MLSFHEIYVEHAPHVKRFALFLAGDEALADDLTSETFLRAWAAADRLESNGLRSYLLTVTRNLHRDHSRRSWRSEPLDERLAAPAMRPEEAMDARAELLRVTKEAEKMPEVDRAVLLERVLEGRPYSEIAARHGIGVGAAKLKVFRARMRLMKAR